MKDMLERLAEARAARRENGQAGFSMIELIVVIAIIGILIAVAIPVYGNIQKTAKDNQLKNAAATGASLWAATFASENAANATTAVTNSSTKEYTLAATGASLSDFCVTATAAGGEALDGGDAAESGPGC